jgi:hypothetical protein
MTGTAGFVFRVLLVTECGNFGVEHHRKELGIVLVKEAEKRPEEAEGSRYILAIRIDERTTNECEI